MLAGVWPYLLANWLTERWFAEPVTAWDWSKPRFRSRRMNETVSGVPGGVSPKTVAPGSRAALMPDDTVSGVFGRGVAAEAGRAGPAAAASGVMTAAAPSTSAAD